MVKREEKTGWVYFIKQNDRFKVGISLGNIRKRMKGYKTHNPFFVKIVELVFVADPVALEEGLHLEFFKKGADDWGRLKKEQVESIKETMLEYQEGFGAVPDYKQQLIGKLI